MMKACFGVGGGGSAPALTARKLGITPRIRFGCCFSGGTPWFAGAVLWPALFASDCFVLLPVLDVPDCSGGELCCGLGVSGDAISADSEDTAGAKDELRSCAHRLCTNRISTSGRKKRKQCIPPLVGEMPETGIWAITPERSIESDTGTSRVPPTTRTAVKCTQIPWGGKAMTTRIASLV